MRILVEAHHPSHIHFFKYPVRLWKEHGHEVLMAARDRDVMLQLLEAYEWIPRKILTTAAANNLFPAGEFWDRQWKMLKLIRGFKPDVVTAIGGPYTQTARLFGIPVVLFIDTEHHKLGHSIAVPFASRIYSPDCCGKNFGTKQRRYAGYHELASTHPQYFKPDPGPLKELRAKPYEYVVVRLSSWNTFHDIGASGFGESLRGLIQELASQIPVWVVPEEKLEKSLEPYRLRVHPAKFFDVLAFSRFVISEGASTASQAACLGVHAVYVNPHINGYLDDESKRYDLVYPYSRYSEAVRKKIFELLKYDKTKLYEKGQAARERLLRDKADVNQVIVKAVEDIGSF